MSEGSYFGDFAATVISDFSAVIETFLYVLLVAFVVGFLFMCFLRMLVGIIVWLMIFLFLAIQLAIGYYCWDRAENKYPKLTDDGSEIPYNVETHDDLKLTAYVVWGIAAIYALFILCACNRIRIAVAVMKAAARFVQNAPFVLLVPVWIFIIILIWVVWWIYAHVHVYSVGELEAPHDFEANSANELADLPNDELMPETTATDTQKKIMWLHFFGFLWINAFIGACSEFIIAGSCVVWYFTHKETESGNQKPPVRTATYWCFRYHLGTLAFGSFILAVV